MHWEIESPPEGAEPEDRFRVSELMPADDEDLEELEKRAAQEARE